MIRIAVALLVLILAGCSSHAPSPDARLSDPGRVMTQLNAQLSEWHGTPYRLGGMSRRGIDCSGFVLLTFRNRFDIQLPRTTSQQSRIGTRISKKDLKPGDLVFSKPAGRRRVACRYLRS